MDDYIKRHVAINVIANAIIQGESLGMGIAEDILYDVPSEDVQPVRHGHWETIDGWDGDELYRCSECGDEFVLIEGTPKDNNYWFCPHCGARMDSEQGGTQ